jgi:hypothetical protein
MAFYETGSIPNGTRALMEEETCCLGGIESRISYVIIKCYGDTLLATGKQPGNLACNHWLKD